MSQHAKKNITKLSTILLAATLGIIPLTSSASAEIAASHVYHNHMPNFWAYYDTSKYTSTPVGSPIRYMYDGQVINLKNSPPAGYNYYIPNTTQPMPHDDLVSYYSHHAKTGAYLSWPWSVAQSLRQNHPNAQMHVTMSGSVVNNVNDLTYTRNVSGYDNPSWGSPWKTNYDNLKTPNNKRTMDLIHFTGHHSMGPLVGNEYLLKDLIYQNATLAQPYFLGGSFKSSKGFFPAELGFSERLIPVLAKLGIQWSVIGNNHFSRTLKDYPLLNDPGKDTLVSPPNRADLQNTSNVGSWVNANMFNEQQVVHNKYPFASTPHWVRHVDPETGKEDRVVGIPVAQAESWEEGYLGQVKANAYKAFEGLVPQKQFFVIAHDGDNSSGRAGSEETWRNAGNVTYSDPGVKGMGIDEYLISNTPASTDVVHVQDGSWIDTRDSSSDPQWHHWRLPFGIWKGQFADFNRVMGFNYKPKKNLNGVEEGMTVSMEYGYHYLERNFALLQAALNYAKTAEQIWLKDHPNHWQPTTTLDNEITHPGNQLNPWMLSFPVKGDPNNNYAGGANPAELAWYFLLPSMDSGFGYYDENVDDSVKPALGFNNSLFFSKPYVQSKLASDQTGPSIWWPQRWPYNPGSANVDKSEGWTLHYFDNNFVIYTYGYDVNNISSIKVKIRTHSSKSLDASDNTSKVYDPAALKAQGVPDIDLTKVSAWVEYPMTKRDLKPDINGVDWQAGSKQTMQVVPSQEIGDLYYSYMKDYRDQLVDYYIEAVDSKGNVTKSPIQSVYVGAGTYTRDANNKVIEDINGTIIGTYPFVTDKPPVIDTTAPTVPTTLQATNVTGNTVSLSWTASTDNVGVTGYEIYRNGTKVGTTNSTTYTDTGLAKATTYSYTVKAYDAAGNISAASLARSATTTNQSGNIVTVYYKPGYSTPYIHYRPAAGTWTTTPGVAMPVAEVGGYFKSTIDIGAATSLEAVFNNGSGTWDNNGGKNYSFPLGTSTYYNGTITQGAPVVDTQAPSTPTNLSATKTSTSVAISWTASTDNVGVTGYEIYRGSTKVGTATGTTYTDSGLTANTTYSYTVRAYDAAGNKSAASTALSVTTVAGNTVTVYYKPGYSTPYIHYRPTGGTWTTTPGVQMPVSEISGYHKITIDVGTTSGLEAVFNNGSGTWDNNGGKNYSFPLGTSTYYNGTITQGAPNTTGNNATIYYKRGFTTPYFHYRPAGGTWTAVPGMAMSNSEVAGYSKITVNVGSATQVEGVFNNGGGTWDNNGGLNYLFPLGNSYFISGSITAGVPSP